MNNEITILKDVVGVVMVFGCLFIKIFHSYFRNRRIVENRLERRGYYNLIRKALFKNWYPSIPKRFRNEK